jgi:drug/metabolite transporter (DMT)-like permease
MSKSANLAAAGTVLLWASAFPAITVAVRGLGPAGLAVARLAVASAALALAAPLMGVRRPRLADLPLIALCGLAGMTGYQLLLNAGPGRTGRRRHRAGRRAAGRAVRRPGGQGGDGPYPDTAGHGTLPT